MKGKGGKGAALAILAAMPKKGSEDEEYEGDEEDSDGDASESKAAAGEALKAALDSGDGAAIADAFSDLMDCCGY
jgi:hypothetical protein